MLHPDRLFSADPAERAIARRLYAEVRDLPIVSPHGHTDPRWFAENVQRHEPALRAYLASRFSTLPDHDDLVQESYLRMLQARLRLRLATAKAFLFATAGNLAIDYDVQLQALVLRLGDHVTQHRRGV